MRRHLKSPLALLSASLALAAASGDAATGPVAVAVAPPAASTGLPPVGDLNGDSSPDLAVLNARARNVSLFFGTGSGLPATPNARLSGAGGRRLRKPRAIAAGDFDADGSTDLVVTGASAVTIFLGNGDGTFQSPVHVGVVNPGGGMAVGLFRGVGSPHDVAVASRHGEGLAALVLGNAGGAFVALDPVPAGRHPTAIAAADLGTSATNNARDGILDVAITTRRFSEIAVLFGDGAGGFSAPHTFGTAIHPRGLAIQDFGTDGCPDAVTMHDRLPSDNSGGLIKLLGRCFGDGFGTFGAGFFDQNMDFGPDSRPTALLPIKLDGDAPIDLAVADAGTDEVLLLRSNNSHLFDAPLRCAVGSSPRGLGAGDFNADSVDDLVVANRDSDTVLILTGTGNATTCPTATVLTP